MKVFLKILTYFILPLAIIALVFLIYRSVMEPVQFKKEVSRRSEVAIERLKGIRTLQEVYKSKTGRFLSTTDSLIDFYKNGKITIVRQIGSMDDSLAVAQKRVFRDSIHIAVKDTLFKNSALVVDSLSYIPFSGGQRIQLSAITRKVSGVTIPLFEATIPYDILLTGLDRQLIVNLKAEREDLGQYPGLKVGDINNANNNAGNWE